MVRGCFYFSRLILLAEAISVETDFTTCRSFESNTRTYKIGLGDALGDGLGGGHGSVP